MTNEGILYISLGSSRRQMLFDACASIRRHHSSMNIHVVSDVPVDVPFTLVTAREGKKSRFFKTQAIKYSPFATTALFDDDTVLHKPLPPLESILGDADIGLSVDGYWPTLRVAVDQAKKQPWMDRNEAEYMEALGIDLDREPHFNSGVMIFRNNDLVRELFDTWMEEWCRFQNVDQLALHRAIIKIKASRRGLRIQTLPKEWNCEWALANRNQLPRILHFTTNKKTSADQYHNLTGTPRAEHHFKYSAFTKAVENGVKSRRVYEVIGKILNQMQMPKCLMFGCGNDSQFIGSMADTIFVESDVQWGNLAKSWGLNVVHYTFESRIGEMCEGQVLPINNEDFDIVIIDGPNGNTGEAGRQLPIMWAASMANSPAIIVHDYDRPWERICCERYLGSPDAVVDGNQDGSQSIAIWSRNRLCLSGIWI